MKQFESIEEWKMTEKLTAMHIKRVKSNIVDIQSQSFKSEEKRQKLIKECESDLSVLYLMQAKARFNIESLIEPIGEKN